MPLQQKKFYTEEEYENFRNDGLTEYNNGEIIAMSPPTRKHQQLLGELFATIRNFLVGKHCKVYLSPFEVRLELEGGIKRLEPDISVICDKNKLTDKGCSGAPDFIIEIASQSNLLYDYITKAGWYKEAGVKEYWIVNPINNRVTVFLFETVQNFV